jgi:hypothetical protein
LANFVDGVARKRSLVNIRIMMEFANQLGISVGQKADRFTLSQKIGEVLKGMRPSEREKYMDVLDRWTAKNHRCRNGAILL